MKNPTTLFVNNLSYSTTVEEMRALFEEFGEVERARIPMHRDTAKPRGFGFVEMDEDCATAAIAALNGTEFGGRKIGVWVARD